MSLNTPMGEESYTVIAESLYSQLPDLMFPKPEINFSNLADIRIRSQYEIREAYFKKNQRLPKIDNIFLIDLYSKFDAYDSLKFRNEAFDIFVKDCSIKDADIKILKREIRSKLIDICSRYILNSTFNGKEKLEHNKILDWDLSKINDPQKANNLKKFINWYAGRKIWKDIKLDTDFEENTKED